LFSNKIILTATFLLTLLTADRLVGWGLQKMYFSQKSGERYSITYALDSTHADLLIFGSSRASHHYIPTVFKDSLQLTCFNTGKDGEGISYNYALLLGIVSRYKPSYILLDISEGSFYKKRASPDNLVAFMPYFNTGHSALREIVVKRNQFEKLKLFSAIYPYNSTLISSLKGINNNQPDNLSGYLPLYGHLNIGTLPVLSNQSKNEIDSDKIEDLTNFIHVCKSYHIRLYILQSPVFMIESNGPAFAVLNNLLVNEGVPFFNFPGYLNTPDYFKDAAHLNNEGAQLYSKMLAGLIKNRH